MALTKNASVPGIDVLFITQVGTVSAGNSTFSAQQLNQASKVADSYESFISAAKSSIHMAIYDFRLQGDAATKVIGALNSAADAGIDVRIAYYEAPKQPTPDAFAMLGSDPAVVNDGLGGAKFHKAVSIRPVKSNEENPNLVPPVVGEAIEPPHNLMHSKYIIRDGQSADAAILMGSANSTTDAWSVQDNNVVILTGCQELSSYYGNDFNEMWQSGQISNTGNFDTADVSVGDTEVRVMFSPGRGRQIGTEIASVIDGAQNRLLVASMVISSGPIMGAMVDRMHRVDTFGGIFDGPEMRMVISQWGRSSANAATNSTSNKRSAASASKAKEFAELARFMHFKKSLPFTTKGIHNLMHNKFAVVDDTVITGSFNFSTNAQSNAENVLFITSKDLADAYAQYVKLLISNYPDTGSPE